MSDANRRDARVDRGPPGEAMPAATRRQHAAAGGAGPCLAMRDVSFAWHARGTAVLEIARFEVGTGEKVFVRGPSGCGKTTLLSLLGGVVTPQRGEVILLDTRIDGLRGSARDRFRAAHIGIIFQMFNLIPYLSMVENVMLPCEFSARRRDRSQARCGSVHEDALRLLADLELADAALLDRPVTELSVGQQQRVAAARALIGTPEVVIADEPTSSLDADTKERFVELLFRECEDSGATLVFVSHDAALGALFDRSVSLEELNAAPRRADAAPRR
ncbi:MAG: ABC transporter ATP-binding protein [Gammaproteobacteria bacterium]|nr:ABC transporter ATP-binding protein [Gammaproteobacteria bacterium]